MPMTSAEQFAQRGDPLATPEDWTREMQIAASPKADSDARASAIAYTQRASMTRRYAQARPAFVENPRQYPAPSERVVQAQIERENLKLMLAGLGACSRTIKPVAAPAAPLVRRIGA